MSRKTSRCFTQEFKEQILSQIHSGKSVAEVCRDFDLDKSMVYHWRKCARATDLGNEAQRAVGERSVVDEISALRRQVASLQVENDILKKAAIILGTNPLFK